LKSRWTLTWVKWVSALFAVHPVQIAAVTYVSGRADILATLSILLSLYLLIFASKRGGPARICGLSGSYFFYFVSVITKELSVVALALFAAYLFIFEKGKSGTAKLLILAPYALLVALYAYIRFTLFGELGQGYIGELSWGDRMAGAFVSIGAYLRLLLFPYSLHMSYPFPGPRLADPKVIFGAQAFIGLVWLTWASRKQPHMLFGWLWFWIFLGIGGRYLSLCRA